MEINQRTTSRSPTCQPCPRSSRDSRWHAFGPTCSAAPTSARSNLHTGIQKRTFHGDCTTGGPGQSLHSGWSMSWSASTVVYNRQNTASNHLILAMLTSVPRSTTLQSTVQSMCKVLSLLTCSSIYQFRRDLKKALFQSSYSSPQCSAVWQTVTVTFNTVRCPCNGLVREVSP